MILDSIVEEVRTARDDMAKECDYDIDRIFEELRRLEASSNAPHVSLSPRRVVEGGPVEGDPEEKVTLRGTA